MSPVWIMKAGRSGAAPIRLIASCKVPTASGLAALLKPIWLSLICTKLSPLASAAAALPISPERGTPPATVQTTAVPAQVMHLQKAATVNPVAVASSRCSCRLPPSRARPSDPCSQT